MESENVHEHDHLRREAAAWLHRRSDRTVLLIGHCPSFRDNRFVCIERDHDGGCIAEFRRWFAGSDAEKTRTPVERMAWPKQLVPTTMCFRERVRSDTVDRIVDDLGRIAVPSEGFGLMVLDGISAHVWTKDRDLKFPLGCGDSSTPGRKALSELEAWFAVSWNELCAPVSHLKEWTA